MTEFLLRLFIKDHRNTADARVRTAYGKLAGLVGIICNLILFAGKMVVGILSGAVSVSADAANNLSDASSSIVTLIGFKLSERPADDEHPYGHARIEYLSGLAVAAMILLIGVELAKSSFDKILHPQSVELSVVTLAVLLGSMAVKLWMAAFCASLGKRIKSTSLKATAADSRNDVISTAAVVLGLLACHFFGWKVDGYIGMLVALFIIYSGIEIAKETISPLLGEGADEELVRQISELIESDKMILGIHDLMVHDYGPGQCFASVHAEMDAKADPLQCHDRIDDLERRAWQELKVHLVIHYDPVVTDDAELNEIRRKVINIVRSYDEKLSIHDFRMVSGPGHTNLIFDIVLPFALREKRCEISDLIEKKLALEEKKYYTVITFDDAPTSAL
ncbi:MAG: cation transporter [Ruminococcaceae bacterium]|nr:cation transporter [Oscillospiraceae bacterium]